MKPRPLAERFLEKVSPEPNTGCWIWTGASIPDGYGSIGSDNNGSVIGAHRASLLIHGRPAPSPDAFALHSCDHPWCVNPLHLRWGTRADNTRDAQARRRYHRNGSPKISPATVSLIREVFASGGITKAELGRRHGVTKQQIANIVTRRQWRNTR